MAPSNSLHPQSMQRRVLLMTTLGMLGGGALCIGMVGSAMYYI